MRLPPCSGPRWGEEKKRGAQENGRGQACSLADPLRGRNRLDQSSSQLSVHPQFCQKYKAGQESKETCTFRFSFLSRPKACLCCTCSLAENNTPCREVKNTEKRNTRTNGKPSSPGINQKVGSRKRNNEQDHNHKLQCFVHLTVAFSLLSER